MSIKDEVSGTPAYLAPEKLGKKETLINDTRRDVYALGVLLKKLLPANIPKDLKAIFEKASAHDHENRYPSPVGMSNDINRYFNKQAISARKPIFGYLTGLFIRRRFLVVLVSLGFILTLVGGYINQSRLTKVAQLAQVEAEELSAFMTDLFNVANPEKSKTDAITALDLLDKAETKLLALENPTLSDARFMHTVGSILTRLDHLKDAKKLIEKSLLLKQKYLKKTDGEIVQGLIQLGLLDKNLDEFENAEKNLNKAIYLLEKQKNTDISLLAYAHNHLGNLFFKSLQLEKAIIQHQSAIKYRLKLDDKKLLADSYNNLGVIYREQNELKKTSKYMHLALNLYVQEYGLNHSFVAIVKNNLAKVEENLYHYKKEEQLLIDANTIFNNSYGPSHYNTITSLSNLILFYEVRMRYSESIELYEKSIDKLDEKTNYNKNLTLISRVAFIYSKNGQFDKSNILHQQTINLVNQKHPAQKYLFERVYTRYVNSLVLQEQLESAEKLLAIASNRNKKDYKAGNYMSLYLLRLKAKIFLKTQKRDTARKLFQQVIDGSSKQRLVIFEQIYALIGLAKIERNLQQITAAHKALNSALNLINSIKSENQKTKAIIYYQQGLTF